MRAFGWIVAMLLVAGEGMAGRAEAAEMVSWEAEAAASTTLESDGRFSPETEQQAAVLSGGAWLNGQDYPEGAFAEYHVQVPADGEYHFFVRKFFHYGPFRWKWDEGEWSKTNAKMKMLDWMPMRRLVYLAWVDLGKVTLSAGPHTLSIELLQGKDYRYDLIYGIDAFLLTTESDAPEAESGELASP